MRRWLILPVVLMLALAACSPADVAEQIIESESGGEVEINENDGSVQIEIEDSENGASAVIGGGEIPDDFPISIPDGGSVQSVVQQGESASVGLLYPQGEYDTIVSYFDDLASGSEEVYSQETTDPPSKTWGLMIDGRTVSISVSGSSTEVYVAVIVGE